MWIRGLTLLTAFAFVACVADTGALRTGALPAALRVDTLAGRQVAFGTFPAAVADADALVVLTVSAAQDWAGSLSGEKQGRRDGGRERMVEYRVEGMRRIRRVGGVRRRGIG